MTYELREELMKFVYDTPAYGAIILTKLANPDPNFYNGFEKWMYHHGWSLILIYRLYKVIYDIHKQMKETVLYYDATGEMVSMSGYAKLFLQVKNLFK